MKPTTKRKQRKYTRRVLDVEPGAFTPVFCFSFGGTGRECHKFYQKPAEKVAGKRNIVSVMQHATSEPRLKRAWL